MLLPFVSGFTIAIIIVPSKSAYDRFMRQTVLDVEEIPNDEDRDEDIVCQN